MRKQLEFDCSVLWTQCSLDIVAQLFDLRADSVGLSTKRSKLPEVREFATTRIHPRFQNGKSS